MFIRRHEGMRKLGHLVEHKSRHSSQGLARLLEDYDFLSSRLREIRAIRESRPEDSGLEREEVLLDSQQERARKTLTHALREMRRELQKRKTE
jgi:hypothetical protein